MVGGVWYRNSGDLGQPFERLAYDQSFGAMHDIAPADLDGDGRLEVIVMSDFHDLRWYRIPADPTEP